MTAFVALSDMHLGYDRSLLNDPKAQEKLAIELGNACRGSTDRLILNGDCFEICVPKDANGGEISDFTAKSSKSFFEILAKHLMVKKLIIVPGNHDYSLWRRIMLGNTTSSPEKLKIGGPTYNKLFGLGSNLVEVVIAYPAFFLGHGWPYCAFHHGHFLDELILGQASDIEYNALRTIGTAGRPGIVLDDTETLKTLANKTDPFLKALWAPNSPFRKLAWAIIRRDDARLRCNSVPLTGSAKVTGEVFDNDNGQRLEWLINLLMADSLAPAPIGDKQWPSYLFVGHDHYGGTAAVTAADGYPWKIINTGGWTDDANSGINPHGHAVVWAKGATSPQLLAIKVR